MPDFNLTVFAGVARPTFNGSLRVIVLGLLFASTLAFAGEPIPGVDVNLGKNPGGSIAIVGVSDAKGQFVVVVKEPGQYRVSTSRKRDKPGPAYQLTLKATGTTLKESGPLTFDFTVGREPVTLRGMVAENDSPRPTKR